MQLILAPKYRPISRSSLLLWTAITLLFLYERTYLIQKAGLPHLVECVVVRVSLLLLLCYVHKKVIVTQFLLQKRYLFYGLLTGLSVVIYLFLQGLYDRYLFGFVIGDQQRAGLWQNLPYNLLVTGWYLLLTFLINRAVPNRRPGTFVEIEKPVLHQENDVLVIKTGTQWVRLSVAEIRYAQGLKDYTIIYTCREKHIVKGSIGKVADWLPDGHFMRVHKSYLVAKRFIKSVSTTEVTLDGQVVPIGRAYVDSVMKGFRDIDVIRMYAS